MRIVEMQVEEMNAVTVLSVQGRVDSVTAPDLQDRLITLLARSTSQVVVDCQGMDYISSAGFRALILAGRQADRAGSRLTLCSLPAKVRQLFELGEFLDLFPIAATRDEAVKRGA